MKINPIKVSELNNYIKKILSSNALLNNIYIIGEVSNLKISKNGITYFTLCEDNVSINCICFYAENSIIDGDKVTVKGCINVYEQRGTYQINVKEVTKLGVGNIIKDLELLKQKLKESGMFSKCRPIPMFPKKIGIITSKNGAAIKDILRTFDEVSADINITIFNSTVQGDRARKLVIEGIDYFNNVNKSDVIMICRGGGSFEDLIVFNDIEIAKEIYNSEVPIVTGIGHETDRTLADFVADINCHTPTAAASKVVNGYKRVQIQLDNLYMIVKSKLSSEIKQRKYILEENSFVLNKLQIIEKKNSLQYDLLNLYHNLQKSKSNYFNKKNTNLELYLEKVKNNDYRKHLDKGYALVFNKEGNIVKDMNSISKQEIIEIVLNNFRLTAKIQDIEEVENVK